MARQARRRCALLSIRHMIITDNGTSDNGDDGHGADSALTDFGKGKRKTVRERHLTTTI